jgi:prefoldin subunit 5
MRKLIILSTFIVMLWATGFANNNNTKTILKSVTVYFRGAELAHTASVMLKTGENSITLEGLSPIIDINSLKININNSVIVVSSEFSTDYLVEKTQTNFVKKLQDSIELINAELAKINAAISISTNSLAFLKKGIENNMSGTVSTPTGVISQPINSSAITQNLDYYANKAATLESAIFYDNKKKDELTKTIQRLNSQLNQEKSKNGTYSGILKLSLVSPMTTTANITITYYTEAAAWTPYYDMNIVSTDKPVVLQSRSKVRQTTGLDWEKIKVTLSTAQPSKTKDAPVFSTWFLDFVQNIVYKKSAAQNATQNTISYVDTDVTQQLAGEFAGVQVTRKAKGYAGSAQTSVAKNNEPPPPPLYIVDGFAFNGSINDLDPNSIQSVQELTNASDLAMYGSVGRGSVFLVTTKSMEDYVAAEEKNISMEFKIDLPYTIPGNGKEQIIDLTKNNLTAKYKYYSAPKLDENVFLIAEFSDWEKLNLLSGMANLTYDGTFVGQTYLNTQSSQKDLSITLGTDKRLSVKREKLTDFSSVKFLGSDTKVVLTYRITVKNNQNKPIHITLKENYPVSSQKDIVVELDKKKTTEPTFNKEDIGILTWESDLAVGESKIYEICYSVKYPKGRNVNL